MWFSSCLSLLFFLFTCLVLRVKVSVSSVSLFLLAFPVVFVLIGDCYVICCVDIHNLFYPKYEMWILTLCSFCIV